MEPLQNHLSRSPINHKRNLLRPKLTERKSRVRMRLSCVVLNTDTDTDTDTDTVRCPILILILKNFVLILSCYLYCEMTT